MPELVQQTRRAALQRAVRECVDLTCQPSDVEQRRIGRRGLNQRVAIGKETAARLERHLQILVGGQITDAEWHPAQLHDLTDSIPANDRQGCSGRGKNDLSVAHIDVAAQHGCELSERQYLAQKLVHGGQPGTRCAPVIFQRRSEKGVQAKGIQGRSHTVPGKIGAPEPHPPAVKRIQPPDISGKVMTGLAVPGETNRKPAFQIGNQTVLRQKRHLHGLCGVQFLGHTPLIGLEALDQAKPFEMYPDAAEKFTRIDGLGDEVGCACLEHVSAQRGRVCRGQYNDRRFLELPGRPQISAEVKTALHRHVEIGDDDLRRPFLRHPETFVSVGRLPDIGEAVVCQDCVDRLQGKVAVIDDQQPCVGKRVGCQPPGRQAKVAPLKVRAGEGRSHHFPALPVPNLVRDRHELIKPGQLKHLPNLSLGTGERQGPAAFLSYVRGDHQHAETS